jgi:hypothetical protein
MSHVVTLPPELRGEQALCLLPQPALASEGEVVLFGETVSGVDAWGAAALRMSIEYHARHRQRRTTLSLPTAKDVAALLHALVRHAYPRHLILPSDSPRHDATTPADILLAARPVSSLEDADRMAETLFAAAPGRLREAARFVAKSLPLFAANGLAHARRAPVPPVACALYDPAQGEVQLVVVDLGRASPGLDKDSLRVAVLDHPATASLQALADDARHRSLDVTLDLASGTGGLRWHAGRWRERAKEPAVGFSSAIAVSV